jgi:glycosyltransferase involved in cell wall biosynthesis
VASCIALGQPRGAGGCCDGECAKLRWPGSDLNRPPIRWGDRLMTQHVASTGDIGDCSGRGPLRTLVIGPHPRQVGGTQSVVRAFAQFSIGADEVRVVPTWDGANQRHNARLVANAARVIARSASDLIVHAHLADGGAYVRDGSLIALARARGLRVVATVHDWGFPEFAHAHPRVASKLLAQAHHVVVLDGNTETVVKNLVGHGRVSRVPNPVAVDWDSPPAGSTEPIVLFGGSVSYRKGADVLVDAWRHVVASGVPGTCRIVGPIQDYEPPAVERLIVQGAVDPATMGDQIRRARLIVLPSRSEALPMILAEALAAARPFISTPVGGIAELAPDSDMLVPVGDPITLAARLKAFLSDRDLASRLGQAGREYCARTRSPELVDHLTREIYYSL